MNSTEARVWLGRTQSDLTAAQGELEQAEEAAAEDQRQLPALVRARTKVSHAVDQQGLAEGALRAATRREAEAQAVASEAAERIRRELRERASAKRAETVTRYRSWVRAALADAEDFNRTLADLDDQVGYKSGFVPSRNVSFRFLLDGLRGQARAVTGYVDPFNTGAE
jgi:hypothetical protein